MYISVYTAYDVSMTTDTQIPAVGAKATYDLPFDGRVRATLKEIDVSPNGTVTFMRVQERTKFGTKTGNFTNPPAEFVARFVR